MRIDRIACDGRGLCAEILPELIVLDDWGFPIIAKAAIPKGLTGAAADAVAMCPRLALCMEDAGTS